jgi:sulfur carrier protein
MRVELNGTPVEMPAGATVADAVLEAGAQPDQRRGIAVAVDGEVVRRADWKKTELRGDQSVEVVHAIQGG